MRALLDAAFIKNKKIRDGVVATHLDQPLMVDMKNANPEARFFRAVIMLCTTVLYYPVIQAYHKGFDIEKTKHVTDMDPTKITTTLSNTVFGGFFTSLPGFTSLADMSKY